MGRASEQALLAALIDRAMQGTSAALVLSGEAGIGKSTLLQDAAEHAHHVVVLQTRGIQEESAIPFAGLTDLLKPALAHLDELPSRQATALRGALAIGPPTFGDRVAVAVATLNLLGVTAQEGPVLCLVDDAHWLDASSAEALVFAARRLQAESVVILFAVRTDEPGARRFDVLDRLPVTGLDDRSARELLAGRLGPHASSEVVDRLRDQARGNPLALVELPAHLSDDQRSGREPILGPPPLGEVMTAAFARRIRGLPRRTRTGLLIAAASDVETADVIEAALQAAGGRLTDLEPAEDAGLIILRQGRLRFRHPLVRSAVYHAAAPAEQRSAHRRLATALQLVSVPDGQARRAWHLAAAAVTTDETVAAALDGVGQAALARVSHAIAAHALERAAQLTPDPERRAHRLVAAATAAIPAGAVAEAVRLLAEARAWTSDPLLEPALECQYLRWSSWIGSSTDSRTRLMAFAERIQSTAPYLAARAYLAAAQAGQFDYAATTTGEASHLALQLAQDEPTALAATIWSAAAAAMSGDPSTVERLLQSCQAGLATHDPLALDQLLNTAAVCYLMMGRPEQARPLLQRSIDASRDTDAIGLLSVQLPWLAVLERTVGEWTSALALAHEAAALAAEASWSAQLPLSLSLLARIEAGFGLDTCREHAAQALASSRSDGSSVVATVQALAALGLLELGLDQVHEAKEVLNRALHVAAACSDHSPMLILEVLPDLIEAQVRAGDLEAARRGLAELHRLASMTGLPSDLAAAERCSGLLARDDYRPAFEKAVQWHTHAPSPYERARTQLAYGTRLRRGRHRPEAQTQLTAALTQFERLGAAPWATRARAELTSAGATLPARGASTMNAASVATTLTPQELQVCLKVARGLSNADTAATLFLSIKTVEYHLSNAYRKLNIRSRTQLVRLFSPAAPGPSAAGAGSF